MRCSRCPQDDKPTRTSFLNVSGFNRMRPDQRGFSLTELLVVVAIIVMIAGFAIPNIWRVKRSVQLRSSAGSLAGLMQQARMLAAKKNATYAIRYTVQRGAQLAYMDTNADGSWESNEPAIEFSGQVFPAVAAPPSAYQLSGDTGSGSPYSNGDTLAFSPRGLPCNYDTSTTPVKCSTPAATYFVYYLTDPMNDWAAVVVTKSGRSKVVVWNGAAWQ